MYTEDAHDLINKFLEHFDIEKNRFTNDMTVELIVSVPAGSTTEAEIRKQLEEFFKTVPYINDHQQDQTQ